MLSDPQIVSTNKKWALGPVLFFNFAILANSRFSAKTTAYKWGAVTVSQVILRRLMGDGAGRVFVLHRSAIEIKKPTPDRDGLFVGRLAVTYFSSDITCLQVSLH